MKNTTTILVILCILLTMLSGWLWVKSERLEQAVEETAKPGLYQTMTLMQTVVHKISYAIEHENSDLMDFYIHELEEATENLIAADLVYHGEHVGKLTETMLEPVIEELRISVENGDWKHVHERKSVLLQACNNCHVSTGYGSIIITDRSEFNPFNQDFSGK